MRQSFAESRRKRSECAYKRSNHTENSYGKLINDVSSLKDGTSSRNGGEPLSAELDGQYKRLRRVVGYCLAHKAQWHNE